MAELLRQAADEDFPVPFEQPPAQAEASAATTVTSLSSPSARGQPRTQKAPRPCKFYATKAGCKNGKSCPFLHDGDRSPAQHQSASDRQVQGAGEIRHSAPDPLTRRHRPSVDPARVVRRPVPTGEDSPEVRRANEIGQLKRRWGDLFQHVGQGQGLYRLELKQSDDFPYDLDALSIEISLPPGYPKADSGRPSIKVLNEDIPRGHQINIERGFADLARAASKSTRLLDLFNSLDRKLEEFLSSEKAATFKIVPNVSTITRGFADVDVNDHQLQQSTVTTEQRPVPQKPDPPRPFHSQAERDAASGRRAIETRQLEARFRQSDVFWKNAIGTTYKVPLEPAMKSRLPAGLLLLRSVDLKVPELYPLEPCSAEFDRSFPSGLTSSIEKNFLARAQQKSEVSLMAHLNYLAQNMHNMLDEETGLKLPLPDSRVETIAAKAPQVDFSASSPDATLTAVPDKPHLIRIESIRPPEWEDPAGSGSESDSDDYSVSDGDAAGPTGQEGNQGVEHEPEARESVSIVERGTSISFPDIRLKNIELLELRTINVTTRCTRCKTIADISSIKAKDSKHRRPKLLGCEKCANVIGIGLTPPYPPFNLDVSFPFSNFASDFRHALMHFDIACGIDYRGEFIHENHTRAGFLDLSGCTVVDLLPSEFVPTCATCSTTLAGGIQGVTRSQTMFANCRSCFAKMSLFIPEIRFLKISDEGVDLVGGQIRRQKENLGLVVGTELPLGGRCAHYRKSTRWFRFSCCNKVFPCDKCHDTSAEPKHPNEHANRMICGACSREQNYRPDDCAFCGHSFVSKNSGFWEGGKGTRDKAKMSKKDTRKYKRVNTSGHTSVRRALHNTE